MNTHLSKNIIIIILLSNLVKLSFGQNNLDKSLTANFGFSVYSKNILLRTSITDDAYGFISDYNTQLNYNFQVKENHYLGFTLDHTSIECNLMYQRESLPDSIRMITGLWYHNYTSMSLNYSYRLINFNIIETFNIIAFVEAGISLKQQTKHKLFANKLNPNGIDIYNFDPILHFYDDKPESKLYSGGHVLLNIQYVIENINFSQSIGIYYSNLRKLQSIGIDKSNFIGIRAMVGMGMYF